ncbi:SDR family oxidoreductase [Paenibacillus sp. CC-CFT747]|nr:SDR family oxidoreductase [Paenibacillus sp. CC-CFT747]
MSRFDGSVVFITGSGRGIGREIAERFAREGAALVLVSDYEPDLRQTEKELASGGTPVLALTADVSDPEQVEGAVAAAVDRYGKIDILVNNAGIAWEEPVLDIKAENWRKVMDVNLNGMFWVAQQVGRIMARQGAELFSIWPLRTGWSVRRGTRITMPPRGSRAADQNHGDRARFQPYSGQCGLPGLHPDPDERGD